MCVHCLNISNLTKLSFTFYTLVHLPVYKFYSHNDVVDGDVDELDEEPNESHDGEANGGR